MQTNQHKAPVTESYVSANSKPVSNGLYTTVPHERENFILFLNHMSYLYST